MTEKKKRTVMGIVIALALIFTIFNTFINSRKEFISEYDFEIKKIVITPTKTLTFYDTEGKEVSFWNYSIMANENISVGDSIYKAQCSEFLYVYKRNNQGDYQEYKKKSPSSLLPYNWFCE